MSVITKKTKCPLCGARNEAGARRCQICTRPLTSDPLVTTAIYEEALWSRPVANTHRRAEIRPGVVAVLVIVAALATNYVWLGYGPDWAHLPRVVEKGSDWKSYRSNPAYRADFPGDPIIESANGPTGALQLASVWVDAEWREVFDATTRSTGERVRARESLHAALVAANGTAPVDVRSSAVELVRSIRPNATLTNPSTTELQDPPYGRHFEVVANYDNWPDGAGRGTVRARVVEFNGSAFISAVYFDDDVDTALFDRFVAEIVPVGAPDPTRLSEDAGPAAPGAAVPTAP